jgi:hypothetical protein
LSDANAVVSWYKTVVVAVIVGGAAVLILGLQGEEWQDIRLRILQRDNYKCAYCRYRAKKFQIVVQPKHPDYSDAILA